MCCAAVGIQIVIKERSCNCHPTDEFVSDGFFILTKNNLKWLSFPQTM